MALRKFKKFIQDHRKPVSTQLELNVLGEETDGSEIADAATVIIGSELSASENLEFEQALAGSASPAANW